MTLLRAKFEGAMTVAQRGPPIARGRDQAGRNAATRATPAGRHAVRRMFFRRQDRRPRRLILTATGADKSWSSLSRSAPTYLIPAKTGRRGRRSIA